LGPHATTVYLVVKAYTNYKTGMSFPSIDTIVEKSKISRREVKERTRERVPLDWAATQNNLGAALANLGERDGAARL